MEGGKGTLEAPPVVRNERPGHRVARGRFLGAWAVFWIVFAGQLAFGLWMNSRGFMWNDALSRATNALTALYSTDPHLAAIGFVWMPLPTLMELLPTSIYPLWPRVVSSGFASTAVTAAAGGAAAALLFRASRAFGLRDGFGWAYALLFAANPMILLFASNGMSEGVAAPFLVGTVCSLTLFWYSGQRRYVAAAALALALGFASLYQAVQFGAAVFVALAVGILISSENRPSAPQGRWRAIEGLGTLFLLPSFYVAVLWVGANAVIMGDPLYFAGSTYSNEGVVAATGEGEVAFRYEGDLVGALAFVAVRSVPFLVPVVFILAARAADGRFLKTNTLSLVLISLAVPLGLIAPQIYAGDSFGWLRYFMYPLFVAAGWGLYEVAVSARRRAVGGLVLAGWVLCAPLVLWAMWNPALGQDEYKIVRAIAGGQSAAEVRFGNEIDDAAPVAAYLDGLPGDGVVALDPVDGWPIVAGVSPDRLGGTLLLTTDRRFQGALEEPRAGDLSYVLVPNPEVSSRDLVVGRYPRLWAGGQPGFELRKSFPKTSRQWRLYEVEGG